MTLVMEVASGAPPARDGVVATIRDITKLRGEVAWKPLGELPNDGKVIEDARTYR